MMMDAHTVQAAMSRGELTEEEAYFVLRFAGHLGYDETMRLLRPLKALRRWIVWFGGWESPELAQWDLGWPAWRFSKSPTPVSLFGHRFTYFGWGWQLKVLGGFLVQSRDSGWYWSPDGTPSHEKARKPREWWQR